MRYSAVQDGLTITTAYAKNWLKVDDSTDDTLIDDLVNIAKEIADNFLQNDFRSIYDEEVGIGDNSTVLFNLDHFPIVDQSLQLYVLSEGTDLNLARSKPWVYGILQEQDDDGVVADYSLNLTTGAITFTSSNIPENGEIIYAYRYRLQAGNGLSIPGTVKMGVLDMLAYLYEHRVGGKEQESISGLGSEKWMKVNGFEIPPDVIALWAAYRKQPGT